MMIKKLIYNARTGEQTVVEVEAPPDELPPEEALAIITGGENYAEK